MRQQCNLRRSAITYLGSCFVSIALLGPAALGQTCQGAADMEAASRTSIESASQRYADMAVRGDSTSLQQNAIPSVASNFAAIEAAIKENHANWAGAQPAQRPVWLLQAPGTEKIERAEFLCGVFGAHGQTANSAVFVIPNLPPGNYAVATFDVASGKNPQTLSFVLQQIGSDWKVGGFYAKPSQIASHDGNWFAERAREFKVKGHTRNAWLYFMQARDLLSPVPFMSTAVTDKLYDEMQTVQPSDLPVGGNTIDLAVGAKACKLTNTYPVAFNDEINLVVKYQAGDVSNTAQTYQENIALIKAIVAKYPEFREAFAGIVARAVEPSGKDYGSLMAMKEIK